MEGIELKCRCRLEIGYAILRVGNNTYAHRTHFRRDRLRLGHTRHCRALPAGPRHDAEPVQARARRIHAVLHDADPTRWGSPPPPSPDRFTDRHDPIADRINAVDWNMGR